MTRTPSWRTALLCLALLSPSVFAQYWIRPSGSTLRGHGAGITIGHVNGDGKPDAVVLATEGPTGRNDIRYHVSLGLNTSGWPTGAEYSHTLQNAFPSSSGKGGAGVALTEVNGNSRPDLLVMTLYDKPGFEAFEWRIGLDLDATGAASSWTTVRRLSSSAIPSDGADIAVGNFDADPRPDAVVLHYASPTATPANQYRYTLLANLDATGQPAAVYPGGVGVTYTIPGQGPVGDGAGVAITNLDSNPQPEIVICSYDAPAGVNSFRWTIGWNASNQGAVLPGNWTTRVEVAGVGHDGEGAGIAIGQFHPDARLDAIFMAYDPGPGGNREWRIQPKPNCLGALEAFGTGCALPTGQPSLAVADGLLPTACRGSRLQADNVLTLGTTGFLLVDTVPLAPPIDLGPYGFPGCLVYVNPGALIPFPAVGTTFKIDIPALCPPFDLYVQGVFFQGTKFGLTKPVKVLFGTH